MWVNQVVCHIAFLPTANARGEQASKVPHSWLFPCTRSTAPHAHRHTYLRAHAGIRALVSAQQHTELILCQPVGHLLESCLVCRFLSVAACWCLFRSFSFPSSQSGSRCLSSACEGSTSYSVQPARCQLSDCDEVYTTKCYCCC